MKFLLLLAGAGMAMAQSNPSWWKYVPPASESVVGIHWKELRGSLFAPAIGADLAPGGALGFPDLELVRGAEQFVIGSPTMLAVAYGTFPIEKLRVQAEAKGLKRTPFRPAELFLSPDPAVSSIAYVSEKLLLVGPRGAIEEAVRRVANPKERGYSPLLARAARHSKEDLWVVAAKLPDPLASLYLPLEIEATAFEGSLSAWDGLHLVAAVEKGTPMQALDFADSLAENLANKPAMAEGTEITTRDRSVLIRMDLDMEQLVSSLKLPAAAPLRDPHEVEVAAVGAQKPAAKAFAAPVVSQKAAPVSQVASLPAKTLSAELPEIIVPLPLPQSTPGGILPPAPPRTVKIIGLDSGTREIPLGR